MAGVTSAVSIPIVSDSTLSLLNRSSALRLTPRLPDRALHQMFGSWKWLRPDA